MTTIWTQEMITSGWQGSRNPPLPLCGGLALRVCTLANMLHALEEGPVCVVRLPCCHLHNLSTTPGINHHVLSSLLLWQDILHKLCHSKSNKAIRGSFLPFTSWCCWCQDCVTTSEGVSDSCGRITAKGPHASCWFCLTHQNKRGENAPEKYHYPWRGSKWKQWL